MPALPNLKRLTAQTKQSDASSDPFSRHMRSEFTRLGIIALVIFVAGIILDAGNWLDLALQQQAYHLDDIVVAVFYVSFVLMVFLLRGWREVRQETRKRAIAVKQMDKNSAINAQLSRMTSLLHACFTLDEASAIIAHFARQFFPDYPGTLYVFRSSRNLLEASTNWNQADTESLFAPDQCWALRQGQLYEVGDPQGSILCQHVHHTHPYICLPMMAHGEVLALLHVYSNRDTESDITSSEAHHALLRVFTEHIALALSNLKLRDSLRQQSIRDPLTGLFNRRYLEEALPIEIERAKRNNGPFSIIMLDLDHFKRFNDTHGHDSGDAVLQVLGSFLQRHVRGGDIACRYGGEEFTLLLPGASLEIAQQRADELCEGVRTLTVDIKGQSLGPLTLSVGIAAFPQHGAAGEMVLQAADVALYQAKREGRDRAVVAATEIMPPKDALRPS
jgi:diguanylate cyclase (GGDEF)-like protein